MERGTDWEYEAVRKQWHIMQRRRKDTNRLLLGAIFALLAVMLFLLAVVPEACIGDGGIPPTCTPITTGGIAIGLTLAGCFALASGTWFCWTVFRR